MTPLNLRFIPGVLPAGIPAVMGQDGGTTYLVLDEDQWPAKPLAEQVALLNLLLDSVDPWPGRRQPLTMAA